MSQISRMISNCVTSFPLDLQMRHQFHFRGVLSPHHRTKITNLAINIENGTVFSFQIFVAVVSKLHPIQRRAPGSVGGTRPVLVQVLTLLLCSATAWVPFTYRTRRTRTGPRNTHQNTNTAAAPCWIGNNDVRDWLFRSLEIEFPFIAKITCRYVGRSTGLRLQGTYIGLS